MVGSDKWMSQHDTLTRLNLQAHHNVAAMTDEFVKEAFISFDRLDCLVHELLVVEAWKDHVFPTLGACYPVTLSGCLHDGIMLGAMEHGALGVYEGASLGTCEGGALDTSRWWLVAALSQRGRLYAAG
jgi:hypothetical protein